MCFTVTENCLFSSPICLFLFSFLSMQSDRVSGGNGAGLPPPTRPSAGKDTGGGFLGRSWIA